jgi:phosphatidylinositol-3-phosphatase
MSTIPHRFSVPVLALAAVLSSFSVNAQEEREIKHVFVIALENHNWTQPATVPGGIEPIYQNPNAPFINSLVNGTALAFVNGHVENISKHVSYAAAYHNVLATPSGNNPHIHPSEPNYLWAEAGTNFGILNDDDPYVDTPPNAQTTQHLSGLLQKAGKSWKSYQEDIDLTTRSGKLINLPLPESQWTVPLVSHSGVFGPGNYLNAYNDSTQYNYAAKHNPQVFFTDTNGGDNTSTSNPLSKRYAPLQQLAFDLANNQVADYNWITPDQYNDMHSGLTAGFAGQTGDASIIKSGDNAVSRLVPLILESQAYKDNGVIILWWDESESDGETGDNGDDFSHTVGEIVISNLAHPNVDGLPYASLVDYTHSSDLRTMQNIFHVKATGGPSPYLGDAANATDLEDLFAPGVIPVHP